MSIDNGHPTLPVNGKAKQTNKNHNNSDNNNNNNDITLINSSKGTVEFQQGNSSHLEPFVRLKVPHY